ncbi:MAG: hypothetical protein Q8Q92_02850 [bacterium]|nr:hypothetical protein [bacterium]
MGLDLSKLEKVKHRGSNTIARCPACAKAGGDRKGEHLLITNADQFGCVLFPGQNGQQHRQRIFELTGVKETPGKSFEVRRPLSAPAGTSVIQKDILGHLGRIPSTHARKSFESHLNKKEYKAQEEPTDSVPSVPESEQDSIDELGPRPF